MRRLKPKECHIFLDGQQYIYLLLLCFFNTIAASVESILFTLRTRQLVGTVVLLYRLYTTARR